ncbi:MAG: hypothetical protein NVV74_07185 [Magnetospirillum sp.]|nr:hypothetical protein [Magnetospirillum sp.]
MSNGGVWPWEEVRTALSGLSTVTSVVALVVSIRAQRRVSRSETARRAPAFQVAFKSASYGKEIHQKTVRKGYLIECWIHISNNDSHPYVLEQIDLDVPGCPAWYAGLAREKFEVDNDGKIARPHQFYKEQAVIPPSSTRTFFPGFFLETENITDMDAVFDIHVLIQGERLERRIFHVVRRIDPTFASRPN